MQLSGAEEGEKRRLFKQANLWLIFLTAQVSSCSEKLRVLAASSTLPTLVSFFIWAWPK